MKAHFLLLFAVALLCPCVAFAQSNAPLKGDVRADFGPSLGGSAVKSTPSGHTQHPLSDAGRRSMPDGEIRFDFKAYSNNVQVLPPLYKERADIIKKGDEQLKKIWAVGIQAARSDPNPVTTGLFIAALNELIDDRSVRFEIQNRHIPEVILFLLFFIFVMNGAIIGYTEGLGGKRAYIPTVLLTLLITLVVFLIIDLDRPRRGLITVKQDYILQLKE